MTLEFLSWLDGQILMSGLTKRQVAKRARLSTATVYQVTTGDRRVTIEFCVKIASALGLPTITVLRRAGFPVVQAPPELDGWAGECWVLVQQIPEQDRDTVLKMLRGVVE
jgi:transcriptional regulator with XRE-family HTH domain